MTAARVKAAVALMTELQLSVIETARIRRESIQRSGNGYTLAAVAELMGVSRARVAQLRDAGPPPERVFLGVEEIRVAVPERAGGRRLVARADSAAAQEVLTLAHRLGLGGTLEFIPISGAIDLNRDHLVVICGPKSSPVTAAALAADPRLAFDSTPDDRWSLVERSTGRAFSSPSDDRARAAGRRRCLPRSPAQTRRPRLLPLHRRHTRDRLIGSRDLPDEHLAELYDDVGPALFSMVSCNTCGDERIVQVEPLTPPLLHDAS